MSLWIPNMSLITHSTILICPPLFDLVPPASETCNDFHPMFFTHDRSFEEFFCICIQLLNKTWKEMRATSEDFNKVTGVVTRHLTGLGLTPQMWYTMFPQLCIEAVFEGREGKECDFKSHPKWKQPLGICLGSLWPLCLSQGHQLRTFLEKLSW